MARTRGMQWDEYRAIVHRPASFLDSDEARDLGYVAYAGPIRPTADEAKKAALHNSEETHAAVVGLQYRLVKVEEPWIEVEL